MDTPLQEADHADLRRLFVSQLPQRLKRLCQRGQRLSVAGWDVNVMALLIDDATFLAGICHAPDSRELATNLATLRDAMQLLLAESDAPNGDAATQIAALVADIAAAAKPWSTPDADDADVVVAGPTHELDFPLLVEPPADYAKRMRAMSRTALADATGDANVPVAHGPIAFANPFADGIARIASSSTLTISVTPKAAAPRKNGGVLHVRHLSSGGTLADTVDALLAERGHRVARHVDGDDALRDIDAAAQATLLLVDSDFSGDLYAICSSVKRLHANGYAQVAVAALSPHAGVADRLHAVRVGCDALIELPASAEAIVERLVTLAHTTHGDPYRVLIVEDDPSQARFTDSILASAGMLTCIVERALDTIEEMDRFHPDLILMDLFMSTCDGAELTALIRQRGAHQTMPILYLSTEQNTQRHVDALAAGADDFLVKPVQVHDLINAVSTRIRRARTQAPGIAALPASIAPSRVVDKAQLMRRLTDRIASGDANTADSGGLIAFRTQASAIARGALASFAETLAEKTNVHNLVAIDGTRGLLLLAEDCTGAFLDAYALSLREAITTERPGESMATAALFDIGTCAFAAGVRSADGMRALAVAAIAGGDVSTMASASNAAPIFDADERDLVERIRFALDGVGLSLVFQPIVSLRGDEEEQFQALLRLQGDDGAVYPAGQIIPVAERAGLIGAIDQWTLDAAIAALQSRGGNGRALRLFVSQSLKTSEVAALNIPTLRERLQSSAVTEPALVLDFRADDVLARRDYLRDHLDALRAAGVRCALAAVDDADSLQNALAYFPFDYVRLGPRFAKTDVESTRDDLRALVKRAHESGTRVVAPRVEDARAAATMWTLGVDYIQGYFVQRPDSSLAYDFRASVM